MIRGKISNILFGGDYSPEQWDDATVNKDIQLLKKAHINTVVLSVFTWALLEPREDEFCFDWLDGIIEKLQANDISICLATPTSAQPAWLSKKYPEVLPVDRAGRKRNHGMRVFFCVNSPMYRKQAAKITQKLAERYKDCPNLIAWHVANEYGTYCYCETCQEKFRNWLEQKYGTIENLNDKWNTSFWGRQVYSFNEIMIPSELNDDYRFNPTVQQDYLRFVTDSTVDCFLNEAKILKKVTPDIPVYTNISGHIKNLDQFKMAKAMDFVGWDNYPTPRESISSVAFKHDLMRALKNGNSYLIAEQSPNQQNWQPYNKIKRPGEIRTIAYQGLAHGGDGSFYFQMKQSIGGQEKFHGAIIGHSGEGDTRIYREIASLGKELKSLGDQFLGAVSNNEVAIYFDWNSWWAIENASGPSKDMDYLAIVNQYYQALFDLHIPVDIINKESDLKKYKILIAPAFYMIPIATVKKIEEFVKNGGQVIVSYRTAVVDENDRCIYGLAPGLLKNILGVSVEETDALYPDEENRIKLSDTFDIGAKTYKTDFLCDLLRVTTAETLATYCNEFYAHSPAITKNYFGKGVAYYIGTRPEQQMLVDLFKSICNTVGVQAFFNAGVNVEITVREKETSKFYFVINHNDGLAKIDFKNVRGENLLNGKIITGSKCLQPREVMIIKEEI